MEVREGVNIEGVCGVAPCLQLLRDLLRVRRVEDTGDPSIFEGDWEMVEQGRDSIRETDGCENARAKEGVTAQGIEEGVFGPWEIRVYPRQVRELFYGEFANRPLLAFADPF